MAGYVAIPQDMLGQPFNELTLKKALWALNPDFNFDWGARLNIWHPYQDSKQGVFFKDRHLCSMDRGQIPQAPIWSTKRESVRVAEADLSYAETVDPMTAQEIEFLTDGTQRPSGYYFVFRQTKDRLLFIGWQATLRKICNSKVPGVTPESLGRELGITFDTLREVEACEVTENRTHLYDGSGCMI